MPDAANRARGDAWREILADRRKRYDYWRSNEVFLLWRLDNELNADDEAEADSE
jgi:hypothetical protein